MSYTVFLYEFINFSSIQLFYFFVCNKIFSALEHILFIALAYAFVCFSLYKFIFLCAETSLSWPTPSGQRFDIFRLINFIKIEHFKWPNKTSMKRVLIITSHPDDECMFFGPVIKFCQHLESQIYLLCLSHGNYEKQVRNLKLSEFANILTINTLCL